MSNKEEAFIARIAPLVQRYAPEYGIAVCSPIIAQAALESAWGTSYKASRNNYFGLKYRENRVPIACGKFVDTSTEQNRDGSYTNITDSWFHFRSMEEGVIGYFQFVGNYAGLKGIKDPRAYLEAIKAAGYATAHDYVDRVMAVVSAYHLTRYDQVEGIREGGDSGKMRINIHAGHNPDGRPACGAIGFLRESTENRRVAAEVIRQLRAMGHTVYDCTCDDGSNEQDGLQKIVAACNAHKVDLDISIHFNAGARDAAGNGKTTGVEVYTYDTDGIAKEAAVRVCGEIAALGFRNRGMKINKSFYVLRNTAAPAMLIECCFVDDKDDAELYDCQRMATAITKGILGQAYQDADRGGAEAGEEGEGEISEEGGPLYKVQVGAYTQRGNAETMKDRLKAAGFEAVIVSA